MTLGRIKQLARMAGGFRHFVRTPVTREQAVAGIRQRMADREKNFLRLARRLIYDLPSSPYRRLLVWAGCEYEDLQRSVESHGIENSLTQLRDAGVRLSLDEFKSRIPVSRRGLTFETQETDFDNPFLLGHRIEGGTSGSRAKSTRVAYDWDFIAEESAHELLLYAMHGVLNAPLALWYPVPPGIAGLHNLLMHLKLGRTPEKWFSHVPTGAGVLSLEARLGLDFLVWAGRTSGLPVPRPEFADLSATHEVVRWMAGARQRRGLGVVRTYGSSAARIVQTARELGEDLSGCVLFAGGEPLTDSRKRFIESSGVKVFPRYVSTETGLIAAACPHRSAADEMHFYLDRLAVVPGDSTGAMTGSEFQSLLFTTLSDHTGKVLLNAELGDGGQFSTKRCSCLFGELGFDLHLSGVRSYDKLTVEGMTLLTAELERVIGAVVEEAGGGPDSYQFWQTEDRDGLNRLILAVSPDVKNLDERKLVGTILEKLRCAGPRTALAADLWTQAGTFQVVRERPQLSGGQKMLSVIKRTPLAAADGRPVATSPAAGRNV